MARRKPPFSRADDFEVQSVREQFHRATHPETAARGLRAEEMEPIRRTRVSPESPAKAEAERATWRQSAKRGLPTSGRASPLRTAAERAHRRAAQAMHEPVIGDVERGREAIGKIEKAGRLTKAVRRGQQLGTLVGGAIKSAAKTGVSAFDFVTAPVIQRAEESVDRVFGRSGRRRRERA